MSQGYAEIVSQYGPASHQGAILLFVAEEILAVRETSSR
jgi:hypothetical protein